MTPPLLTAEPVYRPEPHQDQATIPAVRVAHLLSLIRALIAFGKECAATLRACAPGQAPFAVVSCFGTEDIALIVARIARGLRLAAALETKFANRAADPPPLRPARTPDTRKSRPKTQAQPDGSDFPRAIMPTAEEIAEHLRRYPAHVVLRQICSDLGTLPFDPLWRPIQNSVGENRGSIVKLVRNVSRRIKIAASFHLPAPALPTLSPLHLASAATAPNGASTGPP